MGSHRVGGGGCDEEFSKGLGRDGDIVKEERRWHHITTSLKFV